MRKHRSISAQFAFVDNIVDFVCRSKYSASRVRRGFPTSPIALSFPKSNPIVMKFNSNSQVVPLAALTLIAVSVGCSRSDVAEINGRVKFKSGEAIKRGTIEYAPIDPAAANQSGARIADGAYKIPREKGLRAGKYVVRISSAAFLLSPDGLTFMSVCI